MSSTEYNKVLIPMIRKILPGVIASQLVGVQPMSGIRTIPMETGESHHSDGTIEYYWVKPQMDMTFLFGGGAFPTGASNMRDWVCETYGPEQTPGHKIQRKWIQFDRMYCFREESDRMLFVLKWGGKY